MNARRMKRETDRIFADGRSAIPERTEERIKQNVTVQRSEYISERNLWEEGI